LLHLLTAAFGPERCFAATQQYVRNRRRSRHCHQEQFSWSLDLTAQIPDFRGEKRLGICSLWFTEGFDTLDLKEAKALLDDLA
jgi:hypothetical protein